MPDKDRQTVSGGVEEIVQLAVVRAGNLYKTHKLCCSESIMVMMNRGFAAGLSDQAAKQLGAGFCHGMGGAGCSCGALSGAVAMLGLLLGEEKRKAGPLRAGLLLSARDNSRAGASWQHEPRPDGPPARGTGSSSHS